MNINIEINENLIQEALQLSGHHIEDAINTAIAVGEEALRAVTEEALREYVQHRKQLKIIELFGTIEYCDDYDYKQQRQRR
jgi:Bacterial antitoxin of type II TA system, VapB